MSKNQNQPPSPPSVEILNGLWLDLHSHAERDALFVVTQDLDLSEVATRIASDDVKAIGAWIEDGSIARPSPGQVELWDNEPGRSFRFVIVQPYVLIQIQGH